MPSETVGGEEYAVGPVALLWCVLLSESLRAVVRNVTANCADQFASRDGIPFVMDWDRARIVFCTA